MAKYPDAPDPLRAVATAGTRVIIYTAVLSLFLNLSALSMPLFMLQLYHRALPARSAETVAGLSVIAVFIVGLFLALELARSAAYQALARYVATRLAVPTIKAAISDALQGDVRTAPRVIQYLNDVRQFLSSGALSAPFDALWTPIFVFVLFTLHPLYGILAIVSLAVIIAINFAADACARPAIKRANEAAVAHTTEIGRALRHSELVEAMGMLPALSKRWAVSHSEMVDAAEVAGTRGGIVGAISKSVRQLLQIAVLIAGAYLVIRGEILAGTLFVAMILERRVATPFVSITETMRQWVSASTAWTALRSTLSQKRVVRQDMPTAAAAGGGLTIDQLTYIPSGRDTPVLVNITLGLERGRILGVVGPSGSGKSTLARAIVGTIRPTRGGVYFDGTNTFLWERSSFGRMVGYLPQQVSIMDGTVRENIARMEDAEPTKILAAARAAGVHSLIGHLPFGYDTPLTDATAVLSGGQMQRIALARALFGEPQLLVLDEPNSNLDTEGERALIDAIEAAKARGAIVVLIAHRPSLMNCADEIVVLQDGAIVQRGPRTDVVQALAGDLRSTTKPRGSAVRSIADQTDQK